jgi:hypothetical protein
MEPSINQVGIAAGQKFLGDYDRLSTSDLQACIEAEVGKQLTGSAAFQATEIALDYIYAFVGR